MALESVLDSYPKKTRLKDGLECVLRPLEAKDEAAFHRFFQDVPEEERMFYKHRVTDLEVVRDWCQNIDLGCNFPLLALVQDKIAGCCTLHQHLGGWKRHIGSVTVLVHPDYRNRGLAKALVLDILEVARNCGLEKVEAEFNAEQAQAIKIAGMIGFSTLLRLPGYVKDMKAVPHDYILMGLKLITDEEYAGVG